MIDYIVKESCDLSDFPFWSGARDVAKQINERSDADEIWQTLEAYLDEESRACDEPITDTYINDLIWFETETILGFDVYEDEDEEEED